MPTETIVELYEQIPDTLGIRCNVTERKVAEIPLKELEDMDRYTYRLVWYMQDMYNRTVRIIEREVKDNSN